MPHRHMPMVFTNLHFAYTPPPPTSRYTCVLDRTKAPNIGCQPDPNGEYDSLFHCQKSTACSGNPTKDFAVCYTDSPSQNAYCRTMDDTNPRGYFPNSPTMYPNMDACNKAGVCHIYKPHSNFWSCKGNTRDEGCTCVYDASGNGRYETQADCTNAQKWFCEPGMFPGCGCVLDVEGGGTSYGTKADCMKDPHCCKGVGPQGQCIPCSSPSGLGATDDPALTAKLAAMRAACTAACGGTANFNQAYGPSLESIASACQCTNGTCPIISDYPCTLQPDCGGALYPGSCLGKNQPDPNRCDDYTLTAAMIAAAKAKADCLALPV